MNATVKAGLKFAAVGALGLGLMAAALTPMIEAQDHKIASQQRTISQQKTDIGNAIDQRDAAQKSYQMCLTVAGLYQSASASYELTMANVSTEFLTLFDTASFNVALESMKKNLADARAYSSLGESGSCK